MDHETLSSEREGDPGSLEAVVALEDRSRCRRTDDFREALRACLQRTSPGYHDA